MKFYKTIAENGKMAAFAVNDVFNKGDFISLISDEQAFYWNKKVNALLPGAIDLKDVFNFYRIKEINELGEVFSSEALSDYFKIKKQISAIFNSYKITGVKVQNYGITELIPKQVLQGFLLSETQVLQDACNFLQEKPWADQVFDFFKSDKCATDVLTKMNFPLDTLRGKEHVNLTWQANFRFNTEPGYLNLFNMEKKDRHNIIPQGSFNMVYVADFRQFEVRTYCDIHPDLDVDFSNREIYATLAEKLELDPVDAKRQIIAYTYGQKNPTLDKVLNRQAILDQIQDDFFCWNGYPVILRPNDTDPVKIHTIIQTISQYKYLQKLKKVLAVLDGTNSKFMYPLHDAVIVSLDKSDENLISKFESILEDDVYKVKQELGHNLAELQEIKK